jgi:hypothetical protein
MCCSPRSLVCATMPANSFCMGASAVCACAISNPNAMWCKVGRRVKISSITLILDRNSNRCKDKERDFLGGSHWLHGTVSRVTRDVSHSEKPYGSHFQDEQSTLIMIVRRAAFHSCRDLLSKFIGHHFGVGWRSRPCSCSKFKVRIHNHDDKKLPRKAGDDPAHMQQGQ